MRYLILVIIIFLFEACSNSSSTVDPLFDDSTISFEQDSSFKDFIKIYAAGHYTILGTNQKQAIRKESPAMRVEFDYDFSVCAHEITEKEYYDIMGTKAPCKGCENLPARNLTFGDFVLFANEKSKKDGLDTVYLYENIVYNSDNHVLSLEGYSFDPSRFGYRLPTEAEWVFIASKNWNPKKSWNSNNSKNNVHEVCSFENGAETFCDLAGNVAEWVNDWSGYFKDATVPNFVGAPNGSSLGERVIKGGSYKNLPSNMNLQSRGDVYTVSSSTMAEYVGARLALGVIENPVWLSENSSAFKSSTKTIFSENSLKNIFGTMRAKLVFTNGMTNNLVYIDYNDGNFSFIEINDTIPAYHPDISPNETWVAFCTGIEGASSKSSLYVRKLDPLGRGLVKLEVESAAIPRFSVSPEGDTSIIYVSYSGNNKDSLAFNSASTWQVPFNNGIFGTPQKLFDGAFHGGVSSDYRLAVTGSTLLKTRSAVELNSSILDGQYKDSVWYNGEQACNVSLSQDGTKRTAFLDFGSATGKSFVGKNYRVHERLFIADSTGKLIQSIEAPSGFAFNYTEWIDNKDMLIASLEDEITGNDSKIVLINVKDSSILDLVEGSNLLYPAFRVQNVKLNKDEMHLDLDSLGVYMTIGSSESVRVMKVKMDIFWIYREITEAVIIGSSRTFTGVDPLEIKSLFAINMSYPAEDLAATNYFIQNYILNLTPKLKVIVIALDYDRWLYTDELWNEWFSDIPGYKYDESHDFWKVGVPERMYELTRNAMSPSGDEYDIYANHLGLHFTSLTGYSNETPATNENLHWFDHKQKQYSYNLKKIREILDAAQKKDVSVIGVIFPQSPYYVKMGRWGRYGLTLNDAQEIKNDVNKIASEYKNFIVFDEYKDGKNDYIQTDFENDDHLGLNGAIKMARRIDSLLVANKISTIK